MTTPSALTVLNEIKKGQAKYGFTGVPANLILAQIQLESGKSFNSRLAKDNNNLVGMKAPQQRQTLALNKGEKTATGGIPWARYDKWEDSIEDYFMRQRNLVRPTSDARKYVWETTWGRRRESDGSIVPDFSRDLGANKTWDGYAAPYVTSVSGGEPERVAYEREWLGIAQGLGAVGDYEGDEPEGSEYDYKGDDVDTSKPKIWKRWWFWALVGVVIAAVAVMIGTRKKKRK